MLKRVVALCALLSLLLSFCGCSFVQIDVDGRLRAPHAAGEQNAIQTALEQHILADKEESSGTYVLKYPKMGDYRSAFVMKDMTGDKTEDALAFYALQPEGAKTHIALLTKQDGVWVCVDDVEGLATEIERIQFGDLDGDDIPELFAGFSMYNTRDRRLMMYTWSDDHFVERYSDTYTNIVVDKLISKDRDGLLLFRLNAKDSRSSVSLLTMEDGAVTEIGSAMLDGNIRMFGDYYVTSFEDGTCAVFQDCLKDNRSMITELIMWDGTALTAPLYDPTENITTASARESELPCMDINGDGVVEWPQSFRMTGYELVPTEDMTLWMSEWFTWDPEEWKSVLIMTNVAVPQDGYYFEIPEKWVDTVTATYDSKMRCLTVFAVDDGVIGDELFRVVAFGVNEDNPFAESDDYLFLESNNKMRYELCYNKKSDRKLSMERLSALFHLCDFPQD